MESEALAFGISIVEILGDGKPIRRDRKHEYSTASSNLRVILGEPTSRWDRLACPWEISTRRTSYSDRDSNRSVLEIDFEPWVWVGITPPTTCRCLEREQEQQRLRTPNQSIAWEDYFIELDSPTEGLGSLAIEKRTQLSEYPYHLNRCELRRSQPTQRNNSHPPTRNRRLASPFERSWPFFATFSLSWTSMLRIGINYHSIVAQNLRTRE